MSFRPKQVHWFEAKVPQDQCVCTLEALASTGSVQLEDRGYRASPCAEADTLRQILAQFDKLALRHAADLPPVEEEPRKPLGRPEIVAESALKSIRVWAKNLLETKQRIKKVDKALGRLHLFQECLSAIGDDAQGLDALVHSTPLLYKHIFACPHGQIKEVELENDVFENVYRGEKHDFWFIVGMSDRQEVLDGTAVLLQCTPVTIPEWLAKEPAEQWQVLETHLQELKHRKTELDAHMENLHTDSEISSCLGTTRLLRWYLSISVDQTSDHQACLITGWTLATSPQELENHLLEAGVTAKLLFTQPLDGQKPPVSLDSSRWSHHFGLFAKLLGTPGRFEIDPTPWVAVIVPLLFGFMFPDLGHGLVLVVAGIVLARRNKAAIILVPCGLVSSLFGLLFGEVFGLHNLIPSLVGSPLDHPLEILIATLLFGACLILLGLVFSGVEAWWRGEINRWMLEEAPIIALYLSAALTLVLNNTWIAIALSLIWYLTGIGVLCWGAGGKCPLRRIGRLLESSFQLVIATFSFLRVGAFALAHAGFSIVVLELTQQIDTPLLQALAFVLGHAFIIVVEGSIVMIQTTRLVLFEFFMRFLHFEGRIYKPLEKPVVTHSGTSKKPFQ